LRHENGNLKKRMINNGNGQKNSNGVDCAATASSPPPLLGAAVPKSIQFECDLGGVNSSSGNNSIISSSCLPNQVCLLPNNPKLYACSPPSRISTLMSMEEAAVHHSVVAPPQVSETFLDVNKIIVWPQ
jgi:hypothetical protein